MVQPAGWRGEKSEGGVALRFRARRRPAPAPPLQKMGPIGWVPYGSLCPTDVMLAGNDDSVAIDDRRRAGYIGGIEALLICVIGPAMAARRAEGSIAQERLGQQVHAPPAFTVSV